MVYLLSLVFCVGGIVAAVFGFRRYRTLVVKRQLRIVKGTSAITRCLQSIPITLLPLPVREALIHIYMATSERLAHGIFERYASSLPGHIATLHKAVADARRADRPIAPVHAETAAALRDLREHIIACSKLDLLGPRQLALASSALHLAEELAGVELLMQEAQRAMILHERTRSEELRALALARCARLPLKTAEETRRRVEAGLNVRVA
ncbi:MAG: hypothetical protein H6993_13780 [Pseudomonadales bacterium]|nr:hypothetical protein [Pseudomonadales bacterium]MCP5185030.1 hypothetical protein [Pseudomonadales bacterium]